MKLFRHRLLGLWLLLALATGSARAETVVWSDNFEGNAAGHWTNSGVWHIGSPTAGPALNAARFRTFSGTNCASTQNYPLKRDVRLVCTNYNGSCSLFVPTNSYPRLRFWHWFNFAQALGYVEISTNNGTNWNQLSPVYTYATTPTSGGVWSRPSIDLSGFAGQNVQFAFHFTSGGSGNGQGWFVDDVAVVTSAPVFNFPENFEAGSLASDWAVDSGTWEIGRPTSGPKAAHTGTNCAGTVLSGNYSQAADTRLISPPFHVPTSGSAALNYWQWYSFKNALGYVEINNGSTSISSITNITITTNTAFAGLNTNVYQLFGALNTAYATPLYWNPSVGGWTNATKALGSVYDATIGVTSYLFEAGTVPLIGGAEDYVSYNPYPLPQSPSPTNFLSLQGVTWTSLVGSDRPVGFFGTNYTYTYTTNITITTTSFNWQPVASTLVTSTGGGVAVSPGWTNAVVDLSAFAGQTVQVAFHFTSGSSVAAGWYVDDLSFVAYPVLTLPPTQTIKAGQTLTVTNYATNSLNPAATFTFALVPPATNAVISTNGVLTLTNTAGLTVTNVFYISVADNSPPSLATTTNFTVVVLPPNPPALAISKSPAAGHPVFALSFQTAWTNTTWRLEATTNLAKANWLPVFTNLIGTGGTLQFTDLLATNFPRRFYRAVFP